MKKILFIFVSLMMLASCGSEAETIESVEESEEVKTETEFAITEEAIKERDEFIKVFNSYEEVNDINEIQEPREEATAYWQLLYEDEVSIEVKYDLEGGLFGYHVAFDPEKDSGLLYASVVVKSLGLNPDKFLEQVELSLDGKDANYSENEYEVLIGNMIQHGLFTVNFHK